MAVHTAFLTSASSRLNKKAFLG